MPAATTPPAGTGSAGRVGEVTDCVGGGPRNRRTRRADLAENDCAACAQLRDHLASRRPPAPARAALGAGGRRDVDHVLMATGRYAAGRAACRRAPPRSAFAQVRAPSRSITTCPTAARPSIRPGSTPACRQRQGACFAMAAAMSRSSRDPRPTAVTTARPQVFHVAQAPNWNLRSYRKVGLTRRHRWQSMSPASLM